MVVSLSTLSLSLSWLLLELLFGSLDKYNAVFVHVDWNGDKALSLALALATALALALLVD